MGRIRPIGTIAFIIRGRRFTGTCVCVRRPMISMSLRCMRIFTRRCRIAYDRGGGCRRGRRRRGVAMSRCSMPRGLRRIRSRGAVGSDRISSVLRALRRSRVMGRSRSSLESGRSRGSSRAWCGGVCACSVGCAMRYRGLVGRCVVLSIGRRGVSRRWSDRRRRCAYALLGLRLRRSLGRLVSRRGACCGILREVTRVHRYQG